MVPFTSHYAPKELVPEFGFVPSFGIGILITMPGVAALLWAWSATQPDVKLPPMCKWGIRGCLPYGVTAGILWGIGNTSLLFGMAAGIPPPTAVAMWQCGLVVSGIHGMVIFKEIIGVLPVTLFF